MFAKNYRPHRHLTNAMQCKRNAIWRYFAWIQMLFISASNNVSRKTILAVFFSVKTSHQLIQKSKQTFNLNSKSLSYFETFEFLIIYTVLENGKWLSTYEDTSWLTASIYLPDTLVNIYQERQENWIYKTNNDPDSHRLDSMKTKESFYINSNGNVDVAMFNFSSPRKLG